MALSGRIVASIYGRNDQAIGRAGLAGIANSFPSDQCLVYAAPPGTTANTVVINSVIELIPTGLNQRTKTYWTDSTLAQLATNGS